MKITLTPEQQAAIEKAMTVPLELFNRYSESLATEILQREIDADPVLAAGYELLFLHPGLADAWIAEYLGKLRAIHDGRAK